MNKAFLFISGAISVVLSYVFSVTPIGRTTQGGVSDLYATIITPAPYTFGIWSIIYISWIYLGVQAIRGKITVSKNNTFLLAAAQVISSLWLIPSQYLYITTSFFVMLALLGVLTYLFFHDRQESPTFQNTVSLFFGWILIASIVNFHQVLVEQGWYAYPVFFGVLSLLLSGLFVAYLLFRYQAYIVALVYIWATIGIAVGQTDQIIVYVSALSAGSMATYSVISYYIKNIRK